MSDETPDTRATRPLAKNRARALLEQIEADAGDLDLDDAGGDTAGLGGGPAVCPNCGVPIDA